MKIDKHMPEKTRYGNLVIIGVGFLLPSYKYRRKHFVCLCDCGSTCVAMENRLKTGSCSSCGCVGRTKLTERNKSQSQKARCTKHGLASSPTYRSWVSMVNRCRPGTTATHARYWGRGISVCPEWADKETGLASFIKDMGLRPSLAHSIDRIDVNGHYHKENCRWATDKEQGNNTKTNKKITFDGRTQNAGQWAEEFGLNHTTFAYRLSHGWSMERIRRTRPSYYHRTQ